MYTEESLLRQSPKHPKQGDVATVLPAPQSRAQTGSKMTGDTLRAEKLNRKWTAGTTESNSVVLTQSCLYM